MNYEEAISYIEKVSCSGIMPGLVRIQKQKEKTGHPEMDCNVIHVAGTNGKGSVCTYIASILMQAGYKVGRYVSPTLFDYRERIQVNGEWISRKDTAYWMSRVREVDERMQSEGIEGASAFEQETVMAFLYFKAMACDFVVLETGMGGRLDATNVVPKPVLSVVTSIGMDHMHFLGNTIEAIAVEKGGIIKEKRPVVIGAGRQKAVDTLIRISLERQSEYAVVGAEDVHMTYADLFGGQQFDFGSYKELQTRMVGRCQPWNAAIAVKAVEMLGKMTATDCPVQLDVLPKDVLSEQVVRKGIASAYWQGRFEVMEKNPSLIIDGAHNPDGVQSLVDSMKAYLSDKLVILVMGVFADKDYRQMLEMVSDCSDTLIAFKPDNPRGLAAEQLKEAAEPFFKRTLAAKSQAEALAIARKIGDNSNDNPKRMAATREVSPVRPPSATPEALSTKVVTVEVPHIAPTVVPTASERRAPLIFGSLPSLSSMSALEATPINVPSVSNISTNRNANMMTTKSSVKTMEKSNLSRLRCIMHSVIICS